MTRYLMLFALAITTPVSAQVAAPGRSYTVTSFDRIRVEGPYAVTLAVGKAPFARAVGTPRAIDSIDLRVEGRTLIIRQRSGALRTAGTGPIAIALGTPELRSASLTGAGSLTVDRLRGLSVMLSLDGAGRMDVREIAADRVNAAVQGSGSLTLSGRTKTATLLARGAPQLAAQGLTADELTLAAEGSGAVSVTAKSRANITAVGSVQVEVAGSPACVIKASGSAQVNGCRATGQDWPANR